MAVTDEMSATDDALADAIGGGEAVTLPSAGRLAAALVAVARNSRSMSRQSVRLSLEMARIAAGRSRVAPAPGDRRFTDPAWEDNPLFHRLEQSYLATGGALQRLLADLDEATVDPKTAEAARFALNLLTSAAAPTNFFWTNPAAVKRAFDTAGRSVARGAKQLVVDLARNGGFPEMVDRSGFEVGRNLAVSPGAVVQRDDMGEVIQYASTAGTVFDRPLLVVPPPIGRFYFLDLAPKRSFVEYAAGQGFQVFMLSWRNPGREHAEWGLDAYAARVSSAIDAACRVTGSPDVNLMAFCAGGLISTGLLNHMAATGDERVASVSYAVTLLDFAGPAPITAYANPGMLALARWRSRRAGIISSRQMGAAFTLMRPDDLLFNYVVNNYLLGQRPPAFDILAWNADGTNLPAALHAQFLDIFGHNSMLRPGGVTVLGTPVDLSTIKIPVFVTGALTDHLTPWRGCYRTTQLVGGESTFVLSYSGHIASLVNPPGNPKAHYWTGPEPGPDADAWLAEADRQQGSWWEAWVGWATPRSGERRDAPSELGSEEYPPLGPAPGIYVRDLPPDASVPRPG